MVKEFFLDLASLIYPRVCEGCGESLFKHEPFICNACYVSLPKTGYHLQPENPVKKIFYGRVDIHLAVSFLFFQKKGIVQKMLHALKYKGKPEIAQLLGKWYAMELVKTKMFSGYDYIIPVPLHKKRLQKRGYNQSEFFAKGLSEVLHIPVLQDVLLKTQFTESQTYKTREERLENTLESFCIEKHEVIAHKHILLVDDVITTGATMESCAIQLQKNNTVRLSIASIACAV